MGKEIGCGQLFKIGIAGQRCPQHLLDGGEEGYEPLPVQAAGLGAYAALEEGLIGIEVAETGDNPLI